MTPRSKAVLALSLFSLDLVLALWLASLGPMGPKPVLLVGFLFALWGYVEMAQEPSDARRLRIVEFHRTVFAVVAGVLALKLSTRLGLELGVLDVAWAPVARRAFGVLSGVLLAVWGNVLPKILSPWRYDEQPFDWQRVHRFVGWLAMLSGLGVAFAWLALPAATASSVAAAIFLTFAVVGCSRKLYSVASHERGAPHTAS